MQVKGNLYDSDGNIGTSGQVLTRDATGKHLWQTPSSGSVVTEVLEVGFASASAQGNTGVSTYTFGCTVTNTALGRWTVSFNSPHPAGADYPIAFGQRESGVARDVPKVSVVDGTQTANGFNVQVTTDDNGGAADSYSNDSWYFIVMAQKTIVTSVS